MDHISGLTQDKLTDRFSGWQQGQFTLEGDNREPILIRFG